MYKRSPSRGLGRAARELGGDRPVKAQVELIQSRLDPIVGSSATVERNVSTVDAFQGGERDMQSWREPPCPHRRGRLAGHAPRSGLRRRWHAEPSQLWLYVVLGNVFLAWCADERARRRAMVERIDAYLSARPYIDEGHLAKRIERMSRQLGLGLVNSTPFGGGRPSSSAEA